MYLEDKAVITGMVGKIIRKVDSDSEFTLKIYFTDGTHVNIGFFCADGDQSYFFEED